MQDFIRSLLTRFMEVLKKEANENSKYFPNSPYSASKASADMLVRSYNKTYGLNTSISISSNNFGPNQNKEKFIPTILNCINSKKPIPVYGNGDNIRDWIYVKDNCKAIIKIFNLAKSGHIYNVGSNNEISNIDLVNLICEILNVKKNIKHVNDRFGHDFRYSLDLSKIKKDFKFSINYNFKERLENYITYE